MSANLRVALAHSDGMLRDIVVSALRNHGMEVTILGGAEAGYLSLEPHGADVAVVEMNSAAELPGIAELAATTPVLIIGDEVAPDRVLGVIERGASGFISHDIDGDALAAAVKDVAAGGIAFEPAFGRMFLDQWRALRTGGGLLDHKVRPLTLREKEVLHLVAQGTPAKKIATQLGVSLKTVENHKTRIFDKLGARNQTEAAYMAVSQGLVSAL